MKKKLLAALLATAMTVTMFAGCGYTGIQRFQER